MGQTLLDCTDTYDPDTLKILARAFDAAWQDIGDKNAEAAYEDRRTRLALVILAVARDGQRDASEIKDAAVQIMSRKEKRALLNAHRGTCSRLVRSQSARL